MQTLLQTENSIQEIHLVLDKTKRECQIKGSVVYQDQTTTGHTHREGALVKTHLITPALRILQLCIQIMPLQRDYKIEDGQ